MALYTNSTINSKFIKYKGKVYQKTNTTAEIDINSSISDIGGVYDSIDEALYENSKKTDSNFVIRPIYIAVSDAEPFAAVNPNYNTFDVTVANKENYHPFINLGSTVCLSISGFQTVQLNLIRCKSYTFKQHDFSNLNYKLVLTTDAQGLCAVNFSQYTYTGTPGIDGELSFTIPAFSLNDYFLSVENNDYMGLKINVDRFNESFPLDVAYYDMLSGLDYYKAITS